MSTPNDPIPPVLGLLLLDSLFEALDELDNETILQRFRRFFRTVWYAIEDF